MLRERYRVVPEEDVIDGNAELRREGVGESEPTAEFSPFQSVK
jgi:hypothetical protein